MSNQLPKTVDPFRLAGTGAELEGSLPLATMTRLVPRLFATEGEVDVRLEFGVDASKTKFIRGSFSATLQLECQRCMEAMSYPVDLAVALGIVSGDTDKAGSLPAAYEPLVIEADSLDLTEMIEDEILLALPIVPLHPQDACAVRLEALCDEPLAATRETHRPFASLSGLMKSQNK